MYYICANCKDTKKSISKLANVKISQLMIFCHFVSRRALAKLLLQRGRNFNF